MRDSRSTYARRPTPDEDPAPWAGMLIVGLRDHDFTHSERGLLLRHDPEPWQVEQQRRSVIYQLPLARSLTHPLACEATAVSASYETQPSTVHREEPPYPAIAGRKLR